MAQNLCSLDSECAGHTTTPSLYERASKEELISSWKVWYQECVKGTKLPESHRDFALLYSTALHPWLESEEKTNPDQPERGEVWASQFFNRWLWVAIHRWDESARDALESMVTAIRLVMFPGRSSCGPNLERMKEVLRGHCNEDHINLLHRHAKFGSDPVFLDLLRGKGDLACGDGH